MLPKSVMPGDALEFMSSGDVIILHLLYPFSKLVPPVSSTPLSRDVLAGMDFDEPEFDPLLNKGVA